MVSTRGIKLKFFEGERVLCYEPDPTKAKVLYDSKVLDVVINKDHKGKKCIEYLIHFQGWNSSWDRCVSEEFVLKDTVENRQLQKDLADKSQLQLGAYLYRKERKKHRKLSDRIDAMGSENESTGSPARMDIDEGNVLNENGITSSSDDDSSVEDDYIPIELTQTLKEMLEKDHYMINVSHKLHKLPTEPNVVSILESYWKHFVTNQMCGLSEKSISRFKNPYNQQKIRPEDVHKSLNLCKEILDGLRLYFDYCLKDLLLYKQEKGQVLMEHAITSPSKIKNEIKLENDYFDYNNHPNNNSENEDYNQNGHSIRESRRRTLRSSGTIENHANGNSHPEDVLNNGNGSKTKICPSSVGSSSDASSPMLKAMTWRLLPEEIYNQQHLPPCLIYGATHLTRLLVKLPELLNISSISDENLKRVIRNLDPLVEYLTEHKEWFGEKYYKDA